MELAPANNNLNNIIIKTTNHCCLKCDYCYIESHQSKSAPVTIDLEKIKKLIIEYLQLNINSGDNTIKLIWHGGEPLLAGLSYFKKIVEIEKKLVLPPYRIVNSITTNAVELDSEWISFFKENNFQLGISLDGPQNIHDKHRKFFSGAGSFEKVMEAIKTLQKFDMPFGVLTVITSETAKRPNELFNFFLSNKIFNINFIPYSTPAEWLSPTEYSCFLTNFFDLWFDLNNPEFYVRDFSNIIARIFGLESSMCEYSNCFGNYLGLDTNGDIYMCDLLIGNKRFLIGNIKNDTLEQVLTSPQFTMLQKIARKNSPSCQKCPLFLICTGGCMYRRFLGNSALPGKDIYCSSRKKIILHILDKLNKFDKGVIREH